MKCCAQFVLNRISSLRRDERGYALMATLAIFLFLFVLCAAVYAVGETIHERVEAFVKSCGFTDADIAHFRDLMLE